MAPVFIQVSGFYKKRSWTHVLLIQKLKKAKRKKGIKTTRNKD